MFSGNIILSSSKTIGAFFSIARAIEIFCLSSLESFDYAIENGENCVYPKTTDLDTNGGMIYLTAPDPKVVENDLEEIMALEEGLDELFDWHRM